MKIGLYADPHFSQTSSIIVGRRGEFTGRLDNLIQSFTWMNDFFHEQGVDLIVCLGDLTDKPNLTSEEITAMSKCGIDNHILLLGNHCRSDKEGKINSLEIFPYVINEPRFYGDNDEIFFLPYNHDITDLSELVKRPRIIFSHNDIKGYDLGAGHTSSEGYEVSDILENCDLFINGHLHNGGWVVKDRIMNLGTLSGMNFASCGGQWEPSVAILDTETLEVTIHENPCAHRFKKVELSTLPKVKGYLDNLPEGNYVIQIKLPNYSLAQKVRKLFDQSPKVVASRILVSSNPDSKKKEIVDLRDPKETVSVYDKLKTFVADQKPKYSITKINQIIDKISQKEEGAE